MKPNPRRYIICLLASVLGVFFSGGTSMVRAQPFADIHLHYNWNQADSLDRQQAIERLEENDVVLAVVSSTPPDLALELRRAGGKWIVPFFMPYLEPRKRHSWFNDRGVLAATRKALAGGGFFGIGEFHLVAGLGPSPKKEHPVVDGLMALAREFDVPALIHTEASNYRFFLPLCQRHPEVRIQWAHAGGLLPPEQVDALMAACPNVWTELAARDNDRYVETPIVDQDGRLLPGWANVIKKYPHRFMTGSDPVWPVQERDRWDLFDTGWDRIGRYLEFHRRWLSFLPRGLAEKVRLENAKAFYRVGKDPRIRLRDLESFYEMVLSQRRKGRKEQEWAESTALGFFYTLRSN